MLRFRRIALAGTAGGFLLAVFALFLTAPADGQVKIQVQPAPGFPQEPPSAPAETGTHFSAIKLVEKSEYRQYINVAQDCIKDKAWNDAVTALQAILDNKEDYYVKVKHRGPGGRDIERWTSVKFEANNLLGSMPEEGLDVYEVRFGAKARERLEEAKKTGDREVLADVAQRYLHTKVGAEANDLLATYYLDRGQFFMAALRFERLLTLNPKRAKVSDLTLYKIVLAYRRAGDLKNAQQTWERLLPKLRDKGGLQIGEQLVSVERLQEALETIPRPEPTNPHDWPLVRGNVTNSAQANGSPPLLDEVLWKRPTVLDKSDITGERDENGAEAKTRLDSALAANKSLVNNPVLPGSFPVASGGRLIYRTYAGITAVFLNEVRDAQGKLLSKPGEVEWKSTDFEGSLAVVLANPKLHPTLQRWLDLYNAQPGFSSLVYENSMVGTLSTDHRLVFAVDDLAVPAPPNVIRSYEWSQGQIPQSVRRMVGHNTLQAYELQTGKGRWRLGGSPDPEKKEDFKRDEFTDTHFLGAPLPVGGKLYVLNEKGNGELCLVCLEAATGKVLPPVQALGTVDQQARITHDVTRRTNAVHLAYGEGILVCPTNAGEILGVDLLSRTLAWAYPYREKAPQQDAILPNQPFLRPQNMPMTMSTANWKVAPPVIHDGKVVFTAPDAHSVHCINLRDGTPVWKRGQLEGDLFLAGVFQDKVLLVGKNFVRARRLADGEQLWTLPTGDLPSGQGVASKNVYYLPLKRGEIVAIDVERGRIKAHNRGSKAEDSAPGNLVFYEGAVLSQTPLEVVAYPQLSARLELASAAVKRDPNDLTRLTARGELRLADGQVQGAVADLRTVLAKSPPADLVPRVRLKLYEALTDLFQIDFNDASAKYLDEYKELCKVADNAQEQQQRQARFFRILGQGREAQGNLVDAFQAYREFGSLPIHREEGVAVLDDPTHKVPTNVWLRGRVSAMIAKATPEQRKPLEDKITEEWKTVQSGNNVDAIRSFVGMFDVPFTVGREARLQLADAIIEKNDRGAFLEAELHLEQLRAGSLRQQPAVGGRALETLARLEIRKGTAEAMQLAASYYRELGEDFGKAVLHDGKTGADFFNDLATDKRFLPYLEKPGPLWANAKIEARELAPGSLATNLQGFIFQPQGELTPLMRQHRLILDPSNNNNPQLRLVDMANNKVRWTQTLGANQNNTAYFQFLYQQAANNSAYYPNARFRHYQVKGHLAVLQVGTTVYCLDLDNPRLLWQHTLMENNPVQPNVVPQQVMPDQDGNLQLIVFNQFNGQRYTVRIGHVGAVEASYVCLLKQKSLVVLDPLRGTALWSKPEISSETQVFGDEEYIYLVDTSGGTASAGRALRASDGAYVEIPDFGHIYQSRIRLLGRKILAASPGRDGLNLRLYDVQTGKDVWSKVFDSKAVALHTDDSNLTGVIEPDGKMTVVDARTGNILMQSNVVQGRVTQDDVRALREPLLLEDGEHFYVALNKPVDPNKVSGGILSNNFSNGLRCAPVNGWFMAFYRQDGAVREKERTSTWKKGELHWHSYAPVNNQMVVLEQFSNLPIILFSVRYNESINAGLGGQRWVAVTQSIHKKTGKMVYDPDNQRFFNGQVAQFYDFTIDLKAGTINLIGHNGVIQHYVDDGRKRGGEAESRLETPPPRTGDESGPVGFQVPQRLPVGIGRPVIIRERVLPDRPVEAPPKPPEN